MSEQLKEWANMWGAKVKLRNDMPDDMLRDAIETSRRVLDSVQDFETQGAILYLVNVSYHVLNVPLACYALYCSAFFRHSSVAMEPVQNSAIQYDSTRLIIHFRYN